MWADLAEEIRDGIRTVDGPFLARAAIWSVLSLIAFGVLTAIIPTPFFARPIEPEPFAILVWVVSAPLMGLVAATYGSAATAEVARTVARRAEPAAPLAELPARTQGTTLGSLAGLGAFLAIGCPVCNKIALVLLGTSGAMSIYAPIQPFIGAVSLGLLVLTLAWRLRLRALGTCAA